MFAKVRNFGEAQAMPVGRWRVIEPLHSLADALRLFGRDCRLPVDIARNCCQGDPSFFCYFRNNTCLLPELFI